MFPGGCLFLKAGSFWQEEDVLLPPQRWSLHSGTSCRWGEQELVLACSLPHLRIDKEEYQGEQV